MEATKLIGWFTFFAGVLIIFCTLYFSFGVFTGKAKLPELFEFEKKQEQALQGTGTLGEEQMSQMILEQLRNLFPSDTFSKMLNLLAWSVLAGILIFGGAQIANLGIKLVREK